MQMPIVNSRARRQSELVPRHNLLWGLRQRGEELDERTRGAVHFGDLVVRRLDDPVLVGGMRSAAVAESELSRGRCGG